MTNRHHRRGGRTTPKGSGPSSRSGAGGGRHEDRRPRRPRSDEHPFLAEASQALADDHPLLLASLASSLVEIVTPRPHDSFPGLGVERPDAALLFRTFTDRAYPELGAVALAALPLLADQVLADRIQQSLDPRLLVSGPPWLAGIDRITITGTLQQTHVLGDGDNILIGWTWPGGLEATAVVYIDHNVGTLVKDAFVLDQPFAEVARLFDGVSDGTLQAAPIEPADARAQIDEAIAKADMTIPPFESENWPSCRPLVEWAVRHLPRGGTGYMRPDWTDAERDKLLDDFMASPHATVAGLTPTDVRELADPIVWFGCDWGPGDPLRWSPVSVEIVLANWYARKVLGVDEQVLRRLPDVLKGFVRYAHAARAVPADLTDETVAAVAHWTPEFLDLIGQPGRSREANAARLARLAAGVDPDAFDLDDGGAHLDADEADYQATRRRRGRAAQRQQPEPVADLADDPGFMEALGQFEERLIEQAGGRAAYESLDTEALPDRPFDWSQIPDELREPTGLALKHLDEWAADLYDGEIRTIGRSVLAAAVAADPALFGRTPRPDVVAAAVLSWLTTRIRGRLSNDEAGRAIWKVSSRQELAAAVGLSASVITTRVRRVRQAVEGTDAGAAIDWPSLLHSAERRVLIDSRDAIAGLRGGGLRDG